MKINTDKPMNGWLALSPLALFLCIYLISSVVAADFYKVPIAAAFLLASAYALLDSGEQYGKKDRNIL